MQENIFDSVKGTFSFFNIFFIIMLVFTIGFFIFILLMIFNPNIKSKMMGRQLQATKKILSDNKETIKDIRNIEADIAVESTDEILEKHEDTIKKNMDRITDISKESIETTTRAIKKGIKNEKKCPKCNSYNSIESKYCNECGTKLN